MAILNIVSGAPLWVWAILLYLIYIGIKATTNRIVYVPNLLVIPVIFIILNYFTYNSDTSVLVASSSSFSGILMGYAIGSSSKVKVLKHSKSIELSGGFSTFIVLMAFFITKYIFGYLQVVHPVVAMQYESIETITSSLCSGYFVGRSLCYLYRYCRPIKE